MINNIEFRRMVTLGEAGKSLGWMQFFGTILSHELGSRVLKIHVILYI